MVWQLRFFLFLAFQPFSQVEYLRARRVYCASDSLRIPGTPTWRILGVLCYSFHRLPLSCDFVVEACSAWTPLVVCITVGIGDFCRSALPPPARFLGVSLDIPAPQGGALHRDNYLASLAARFHLPWFGQVFFISLFVILSLPLRRSYLAHLWRPLFFEVACLLVLLWRACLNSVHLARCVGRGDLLNSHLILFNSQLSLVLSLLSFDRGEEIIV